MVGDEIRSRVDFSVVCESGGTWTASINSGFFAVRRQGKTAEEAVSLVRTTALSLLEGLGVPAGLSDEEVAAVRALIASFEA